MKIINSKNYFRVALLSQAAIGFIESISIFLPFAHDSSPLSAIDNSLFWFLAPPFFLSLFILTASLLLLYVDKIPRAFTNLIYFLCILASVFFLKIIAEGFADWPADAHLQAAITAPFVLSVFLGLAFYKLFQRNEWRKVCPIIAMQSVYTVNAVLCLILFYPDIQAGAYLVATAILLFMAQLLIFFTYREDLNLCPTEH